MFKQLKILIFVLNKKKEGSVAGYGGGGDLFSLWDPAGGGGRSRRFLSNQNCLLANNKRVASGRN
jgi:hypothetical protein